MEDAQHRDCATAARQRAAELAEHRDQPLYEGAQCCSLEAHLRLYNWYCKYAIKQRAFEALLKLLALLLPANSTLARTLFLFRKVSTEWGCVAAGHVCESFDRSLPGMLTPSDCTPHVKNS
jgi:hypothetical protein